MPLSKPMRYAHSDGHTDVCFDSTGRYMLTCGSDGDVRIWDGIEDDDAVSHRVGDRVFAIAYKSDRFFTTTETNTVQAHTFPDGGPDGILTRFTAPVSHMVLDGPGKVMVVGASDFAIKIVDVDSCSQKTCQGHEAPVLSVAIDPQNEFLASSSCDGTVRIWKLSDQSLVKTFNLINKCSDISLSKTLCRLCWDVKKGEHLYVPVEKEVQIYDRNSWNKVGSLTDEDIKKPFSITAMSPDSTYLAAASADGVICVFNLKTKKCVERHIHDKGFAVTAMAWNPKGNMEIAFCDGEGQLGVLENVAPPNQTPQVSTASETRAKETQGIFDDEDDDFLVQASNDKQGTGTQDSDNDDDGDDFISKLKPLADLDSDDDNASLGEKKSGLDLDDDASSVSGSIILPQPSLPSVSGWKPPPIQQAFQPGSTPVHLSNRFMVWNSVGMIRQYSTDEENSIDIEFHDTAVHHAMHITNNNGYNMADMSTEAVVLASECDVDSPSTLTCMHFASWDNFKEWTIAMPEGEEIQALTLGEGWIAAATDARNVRLFTVGGIQKQMFSLPGSVVCLSGYSNQLLAVYHLGMGISGDQHLGATLMYVDKRKSCILRGDPIPLSVKATLAWIGFSAEGTPFYMDSSGIIRMLNRGFSSTWIQVANTKSHAKGKSDHYWIVGVNENPQQLRCIPCKGSRYPPTLPRPAVSVLPFQIPMCELNTEKSQYEETLWKTRLFSEHFDHWSSQGYDVEEAFKTEALKPAQEALMKLFALSARSDREFRAVEVCEMMPEQHTLQLAIKYASRLKHIQLAQRISEVAVRKEEEATNTAVEDEDEADFRTQLNASHNNTETEWSLTNGHQHSTEEEEQNGEGENEGMDTGETEEQSKPFLKLNTRPTESKPTRSPFSSAVRSNPFKVSSQSASTGPIKGTQVFDTMKKGKSEKVPVFSGINQSKANKVVLKKSQPKLFQSKKAEKQFQEPPTEVKSQNKPPSAFDLWLEAHRSCLRDENPDLGDGDFSVFAAERFRSIPKEERQEWIQKAKEAKGKSEVDENVLQDNSEVSENKKRKREEDTEVKERKNPFAKKQQKDSVTQDDKKKLPLSQTTNSKLASFSFQKTD